MWMGSHNMRSFLTGSFHLWLHYTYCDVFDVHSCYSMYHYIIPFPLLNNTPLSSYNTYYLSIHQLIQIWVVQFLHVIFQIKIVLVGMKWCLWFWFAFSWWKFCAEFTIDETVSSIVLKTWIPCVHVIFYCFLTRYVKKKRHQFCWYSRAAKIYWVLIMCYKLCLMFHRHDPIISHKVLFVDSVVIPTVQIRTLRHGKIMRFLRINHTYVNIAHRETWVSLHSNYMHFTSENCSLYIFKWNFSGGKK